jgi:hypothetical protein
MKHLFFLLLVAFQGINILEAQTVNSVIDGTWNTGNIWNTGISPKGSESISVSTNVTVDADIDIHNAGSLDISGSLIETSLRNPHSLNLRNNTSMTIEGNTTFSGCMTIENNATLTINSGTLTVGCATFLNNSVITLNAGASLVVNGDLVIDNNSGTTDNGAIIVYGNVTASNNSYVTGITGYITATGTMQTYNNAYIFGGTGSCSNCTASITNPLPVELLSFNVTALNKEAKLTWTTATETNNEYFTLERSSDGQHFSYLDKVAGSGNSSSILNYSYIDQQPLSSMAYYRLSQTDYNGKRTYLKVVVLSPSENNTFRMYPNPVSNGTIPVLEFSSPQTDTPVLISIQELSGRELNSKTIVLVKGEQYITPLDGTNRLSKGMYIVTATSGNAVYKQKLIIQ